jgi:cytochrome d ubiquinol oxidase subunit I
MIWRDWRAPSGKKKVMHFAGQLITDLDPLSLSRWQFGLTTVYHFLFVPLTIGMVFLVAIMQTMWVRTDNEKFLKMTKLFGKLFLINFAMGVVTGIVQEFQFGMNWSNYSRFVGDVFGAPLAMEGLLAFFFESTFIGLWIFGWGRLSKKVHLATIWITTLGVWLSAYFILAANAFMQHPVGFEINPVKNRAELTDIGAVLTNIVALNQFPHTITASIMFAGGVMVAVAAYHLKRKQYVDSMYTSLRFGLWTSLLGGVGTLISGDGLGLAMVQTQPMKMAAAEALYRTSTGYDASFSIFSWGTPDGASEIFSVRIPYLLSFLSTHSLNGTVEGLNDLQAQYVHLYGPGNYMPIIWITYWAFRWMIGLGALAMLVAFVGLIVTRKNRIQLPKWVWNTAIWASPLTLLAISVGWTFTEMGRQPWIVFGLMKTADGVSPGITGLDVLISLIVFTLIYGVLAVVEFGILTRAVAAGPDVLVETNHDEDAEALAVAY